MPRRLDAGAPGFADALTRLVADRRAGDQGVTDEVRAILAEVEAGDDAAVAARTRRHDGIELPPERFRLTAAEVDRAADACPPAAVAALETALARITAFHERLRPTGFDEVDALGVRLGVRWTPIEAVGLYVPGGTAAYPSSVLMNAVPARVAGCGRIAMTVPTFGGPPNPAVMAAARLAGIDEVYRLGGAQAVAALAFGTASVPAVDKIVGPGNAYVAEAKRQLFGRVGIDMVAGPSEVVIVADAQAPAAWVAADLLAQAEHDRAAQSVLITDDPALAEAVLAAVERQLAGLERAAIAKASWAAHGAVIVVASLAEAAPVVDALAPEHLQLMLAHPEPLLARIKHAGSIFLGAHTPEVIGDYVGGPNHVLPTGRTARFASGLSVQDFMKRTTLLGCPPSAFRALGPAALTLALAEGLGAHAEAIALRLAEPRQ